MNDQEIDKLLEILDVIAQEYDCEIGLATGETSSRWDNGAHNEQLRQAVRDWLVGQSESFYQLEYQLAIVIPQEWWDKELE